MNPRSNIPTLWLLCLAAFAAGLLSSCESTVARDKSKRGDDRPMAQKSRQYNRLYGR